MEDLKTLQAWRIFRIQAELIDLRPAVSIFGSARLLTSLPYYQDAITVAHNISCAKFSVSSDGSPSIMEAANKGAYRQGDKSVGLNIALTHEQSLNSTQLKTFV